MFLHSIALRPSQVRGKSALLVAEIAVTSLAYDLSEKADLYLDYGVREYWVIDVEARVTHVHLLRSDGQWDKPAPVPFDVVLTLTQIPGVTVRLSDLVTNF